MKNKSKGKVIPMIIEPIDSEVVKDFVQSQINFPITEEQWGIIDEAMNNYWNSNRTGSTIYSEENASCIYDLCKQKRMLISYERIVEITEAIWEYLSINGYLIKD